MRRLLTTTLLVCLCVLSGLAQGRGGFARRPRPSEGAVRPITSPSPPPPSAELLKHQHEQTKKLSARLAKLAAEVDEELNESGENILPLRTLKKLKEIEKLARKVGGRIKQ